jgi:acyl-coenzyme A thioesterase PaaI-like protein
VTATSKPLHKGRRFIVVETELSDDEDRLVAKVTQTQAVV